MCGLRPSPILPLLNDATEKVMLTGEVLYLALVVGVFVLFSVTLAYQTWQQSRPTPQPAQQSSNKHEPHGAVPT
jgi:hypothetical protein